MASYIKTLKEDNGDITYPQTLASAVFTSGGSDVETELTKYVTAEDIASTSAISPVVSTSMIQDEAVTTAKIDDEAVTAAKVDFSTFGVAATVDGPSSTTSKSNGAAWASIDMYTGSVTLDAGVYLVITSGSAVTFSAGGEQEWATVTVDGVGVAGTAIAYFSGAFPPANPIGITTISASGTHTVAYQLGAQGSRTCTLYTGSKIQFVRIG